MEPSNRSVRDEDFSQDNDDGQWSRNVETDHDAEDDDDNNNTQMHAPSLLSENPLPNNHAGSVTTDFDDDDDDDDDDEDNWSRKVETDDIHRLPSSVIGETVTGDDDDEDDDHDGRVHLHGDMTNGSGAGAPRREEPTLKEMLVERERQRRVESERARWKRQFAMAAHTEADDEDNHLGIIEGNIGMGSCSVEDENEMGIRETNSVAGTVGEDTVAPVETLEEENANRLNYPMERFLQDQGNVLEDDTITTNKWNESSREGNQNQGVVMERFLQETPVVVVDDGNVNGDDVAMSSNSHVHRSVSFETDQPVTNHGMFSGEDSKAPGTVTSAPSLPNARLNLSTASSSIADTSTDRFEMREDQLLDRIDNHDDLPYGLVNASTASFANASTICLPPAEDEQESRHLDLGGNLNDTAPDHNNVHLNGEDGTEDIIMTDLPQNRVILRLTEAEIQEMAAIDEASRSNAPPSERDDMSELGELVNDFGGGQAHMMMDINVSQGTPTTVMESASSVANQSGVIIVNMSSSYHAEDQHSVDALGTGSISSHVVPSSAGGDASVAAHPPSDSGRDDEGRQEIRPVPSSVGGTSVQPFITTPLADMLPSEQLLETFLSPMTMPRLEIKAENSLHVPTDETVVNRTMRPGMFNYKQAQADAMKNIQHTPSSPIKKAASYPDHIVNNSIRTEHIDDFDFDKNEPPGSPSARDGSNDFNTRNNDPWSPGLSPLHNDHLDRNIGGPATLPLFPSYGTALGDRTDHDLETQRFGSGKIPGRRHDEEGEDNERYPLVEGEIQRMVGVIYHRKRGSNFTSLTSIRGLDDVTSIVGSVFSDIRSQSTETKISIGNDAENYEESSILQRAFPERLFALGVTLLLEIPVLLMVTGGSERLCHLIGRTKYQLLIGFLPLASAISGNVGLQSSTLTTRAISHGQVRVENYTAWLVKEIGASVCLGFGMGGMLGTIAYVASSYSFPFALTIMIAQFVSIVTAGCTGTFAPLIFTFVFQRDSGKWGGPLETAVQDIVGSFAMVVISYQILLWFGPIDIDPSDVCGGVDGLD